MNMWAAMLPVSWQSGAAMNKRMLVLFLYLLSISGMAYADVAHEVRLRERTKTGEGKHIIALADYYREQGDDAKAEEWLKQGAFMKHLPSALALARFYRDHTNEEMRTKHQEIEGYALELAANETGVKRQRADIALAEYYLASNDASDHEQGAAYVRNQAVQGSVEAMRFFAAYQKARGGILSAEAMYWLRQAAQAGDGEAIRMLEEYNRSRGVSVSGVGYDTR